jgi:2-isopropylmalate synthase
MHTGGREMNYKRYKRVPVYDYPEREWPSKQIEKAPIWCSVDLRDGNQALIDPMTVDEKIEFYNLLLKLGFKEIEVGFPAASQIEYDFIRRLIDEKRAEDIRLQVLSQCRKEQIDRTFECIARGKEGCLPYLQFDIHAAARCCLPYEQGTGEGSCTAGCRMGEGGRGEF